MKKITAFLLLILIFTGCTTIEKKGYNFELSDSHLIREGVSNQDMIIKLMGSPTFITDDSGQKELWIYFSEDVKKFLFFKPKILERKIMVISFDQNGISSKINYYDLNNQTNLSFESDYTKVQSTKQGFWSQIFDNIGQVRAQ